MQIHRTDREGDLAVVGAASWGVAAASARARQPPGRGIAGVPAGRCAPVGRPGSVVSRVTPCGRDGDSRWNPPRACGW